MHGVCISDNQQNLGHIISGFSFRAKQLFVSPFQCLVSPRQSWIVRYTLYLRLERHWVVQGCVRESEVYEGILVVMDESEVGAIFRDVEIVHQFREGSFK